MNTLAALACLLLLNTATVHAATLNRVVAVVNGEMISSVDLDKNLRPEFLMRGQDPDKASQTREADVLRREVLENMIMDKIMSQEAAREKIDIPEAAIDQALEEIIAQSNLDRERFFKQSASQGITQEMLRGRLRSNMINQQLINKNVISKVVITPEEIASYTGQAPMQTAGRELRVAVILYPAGEDSAAWANKIAKGQEKFENVAKKISIGPNPQDGGDMGYMAAEDLAPAIAQAAASLKKGETSGLVDIGSSKGQIRLLDSRENKNKAAVSAPQPVQMDQATMARIEQELRQPRLEARFNEYRQQLRSRALVDIKL